MNKISQFFIFSFLSISYLFGQGENNIWQIGNFRAIDFNIDPPQMFMTASFIPNSGFFSSVCDNEGNLLFYSDGEDIWDNEDKFMPNGLDLVGRAFISGETMNSLVVPMPEQSGKFYLFTMGNPFTALYTELRYSIVDMSLNEGKGDIVGNRKSILLRKELTGILIAAKGMCGSIWVVVHETNSNRFLAYEVNELGIQEPIVSEIGSVYTRFNSNMSFSPDLDKALVISRQDGIAELYDFDKLIGQFTKASPLSEESNLSQAFSSCFSSDGKKLYIGGNIMENGNGIFQFDLNNEDIVNIANSRIFLTGSEGLVYPNMQRGPDGRIYVTGDNARSIHVIQNPNLLGDASVFQDSLFWVATGCCFQSVQNLVILPDTTTDSLLLPQDTQLCQQNILNISIAAEGDSYEWQDGSITPDYQITTPGTYWVNVQKGNCTFTDTLKILSDESAITIGNDTLICENESLQLQVNSIQGIDYQWQDGSQNPVFTLDEAGVYWVESTDSLCSSRDSLTVAIEEITVALPTDTVLCEEENLLLTPFFSGENIQWQNGSTNPVFTVEESGTYWIELSQGNCKKRDSIEVRFEKISVDLPADTVLCSGEKLLLDLSALAGAIRWQDGSIASTFLIEKTGKYQVELSQNGCSAQDNIMVTFQEISIKLPNDTTICDTGNLLLDLGQITGSLNWQDGSNATQYLVTQSGQYWIRLAEENCLASDTINVEFAVLALNLGADTTICEGESLQLDITIPNATYQWQDNSTLSSLIISQPGSYWVKVALASCTRSDSILINIAEKISINLGNDTTICASKSLQLSAQINGTYQWQDGSTEAAININKSGLYWLAIQTENCLTRDSILVEIEACEEETPCQVYIPNVFSPNNDGMNDAFQLFSNCELVEFSLEVYDRWGNRLFSTTDILQSWDGRMNNKELEAGVYLVKTNYRLPEQQRVTLAVETVTIIR